MKFEFLIQFYHWKICVKIYQKIKYVYMARKVTDTWDTGPKGREILNGAKKITAFNFNCETLGRSTLFRLLPYSASTLF